MRVLVALALGMATAPAQAEVRSSGPTHFTVESRAVVAATPAEAFTMLGSPGEWWSGAHTYSGDATNMKMELKAGGCFCESVPRSNGTVEHMRVVHAQPGAMLRLQGGLGPLQAEAVAGTLTWSLKAVEGGTEITQTYVVSGHVSSGMEALAPLVDRVLAEQLSGLQKRLGR